MKKKIKGLISIYLAAVLCLWMPMSAFAANGAYFYTGTEKITAPASLDYDNFEEIDIDFTKTLSEQLTLVVPSGKMLAGWKLWGGGLESGGIYFTEEAKSVQSDYTVTETDYQEITELSDAFVVEAVFDSVYRISQQPTVENGYEVLTEVYCDGEWVTPADAGVDVSYLWYEVEKSVKNVAETASASSDEIAAEIYSARYEEGLWYSDDGGSEVDIYLPVKAGEVIKVTAPDTFDGEVSEYNGADFDKNENIYTYEVSEDKDEFNIYISSCEDSEGFKIEIVKEELGDGISDQTTNVLTEGVGGNEYLCIATFDNGEEEVPLRSDSVIYHEHTYSYSGEDSVITESYGCSCTGHSETAEIKAPENLVYDGEEKEATVSYSDNWQGGELEITYTPSDIMNAGSVTASIETDGEEATVSYEIKAKQVSEEIDIEKPRAKRVPVTELVTDEYNAAVSWTPVVDEKFGYETVYTAEIVISPNTNYTYEGVEFTVPGATSVVTDNGTVTAVFPKTGKKPSGGGTSGGDDPRYFNIQFETNGGSEVKMQSVKESNKVTEPEEPTKEGAEFDAWYTDSELTEEYDFDTKVMEGFTLYAAWTADEENDKTDGKDKEVSGSSDGGDDECSRNIECPITPFKDGNPHAWYHDGVHYCLDKGYMIGYSADMFHPDDTLTRAMIVTIIWRIDGKPEAEYELKFTDVAEDAYYAEALKWAVSEKIVAETEEFKPDELVTREAFASLLYEYAKYKGMDVSGGENTNILSYEDFAEISEEAIPAMQFVASTKVVIGKTLSTLNPKDSLTRAEFSEMIFRFLD